jgi:hypothetical protein
MLQPQRAELFIPSHVQVKGPATLEAHILQERERERPHTARGVRRVADHYTRWWARRTSSLCSSR